MGMEAGQISRKLALNVEYEISEPEHNQLRAQQSRKHMYYVLSTKSKHEAKSSVWNILATCKSSHW